jgi:hypothetical protein
MNEWTNKQEAGWKLLIQVWLVQIGSIQKGHSLHNHYIPEMFWEERVKESMMSVWSTGQLSNNEHINPGKRERNSDSICLGIF